MKSNGDSMLSGPQAWPAEGLEEIRHCPVCSSIERDCLYTGLTDRVFRRAQGQWDVYQCNSCRTAYLDPRPTPATISMAYQAYYTHKPALEGRTEDLTFMQRQAVMLANGYRNWRFGGNLEPASRAGGMLIRQLPLFRQFLDRELRFLPPLKPGARLLDVGFGSGAFLMLAQQIGWQVSGVDTDPVTVENAREAGLDVRQGGIEAFDDSREEFDVIAMNHVIEHVHDPVETLNQAYAGLKSGGVLYVETPNIDAYGHHRFKEHWRGLEIPRHLVLFNWQSITELLKKTGFKKCSSIPIAWSYASMAAKSRAIRNGRDPYLSAGPTLLDRLIATRLFYFLFKSYQESEFITLIAHK